MDYIVIDVREPDEFLSGHVSGALNILLDQLMRGAKELIDLSKDTRIIVYCRTGNRSNVAINILNSLGFTNIENGINKDQVEAQLGMH